MKKTIVMILSVVCILALMVGLTGCTPPDGENSDVPQRAAVCYVIANTANSQGLNMNSPLVQDTVYSTIRNYGYISVVNADGVPEIVCADSFDINAKYKSASEDKLDMDARAKATNFIAGMQGVIATDPEVDYLAALNLAVRSLSSLEGYDSKIIVVIGTGLSTSGVLDFQNNLISADPSTIVEVLKEKGEIPNFSGTVYWQQLGDVAAPQQALTSAQRNTLQQIYGGIVEAGGGIFVYNDIIANPVNEGSTYPAVTPVELPEDTPISFEPEILDVEDNEDVFTEPVVLTEEQVTFIGDKAEYLQPEAAESVLKPIAEYLINNDVTILLCGTTAGDTNGNGTYAMELSQARAETVKQTLVNLNVDPDRIIAVGLGSTDPWHVYGIPTSDKAASCNRKTVLLDAASETAHEILAGINE